MRLLTVVVAGALIAGVAATGADDGLKEYKVLMKAAAKADNRLKSALDGEDAQASRAAAEALSLNMAKISDFWTERDVEQAAEWAASIQRAGDDIATSVEASDFAAAQASFDGFREDCRSCHQAHRKMSLRGYRFK